MSTEKLDQFDRRHLRKEIGETLLAFSLVLILGLFVGSTFILLLEQTSMMPYRKLAGLMMLMGYGITLLYKLLPQIIELKKGLKNVTVTRIEDKTVETQFGVGTVPIQPKLTEHFFTLTNLKQISVEEGIYNQANIGDIVTLHSSIRTGKVLQFTTKRNRSV
jgi:hypothetical protein